VSGELWSAGAAIGVEGRRPGAGRGRAELAGHLAGGLTRLGPKTGEGREKRKKIWIESNLKFSHNFYKNLKIFKNKSCSKFNSPQLFFQLKLHLRFSLNVKFKLL
jgi:hypothetical protein